MEPKGFITVFHSQDGFATYERTICEAASLAVADSFQQVCSVSWQKYNIENNYWPTQILTVLVLDFILWREMVLFVYLFGWFLLCFFKTCEQPYRSIQRFRK